MPKNTFYIVFEGVEGCCIMRGAGVATRGVDAPCKGIGFAVAQNVLPVVVPRICIGDLMGFFIT